MCIFTTVMMRKRLSILMILLANILILVHVVIPHHHYNKVFVAVVNMLNEDTRDLFNHEYEHEHHQNRDTDPAHHHDCNKEDCMMNEAVAAAVLKGLASANGVEIDTSGSLGRREFKEKEYDRLADVIEQNMDMDAICGMLREAEVSEDD